MAITTITINDKQFQIACSDDDEEKLRRASQILATRVGEMKAANPRTTTEFLLLICALELQNEVNNLQNKILRLGDNNDEDKKVAETLSTISGYLETLAQKINK